MSGAIRLAWLGSFALLSAAVVLSVLRLARGPSTPDRVVALDLLSTIAVGFVAVYAVPTHQALFLRPAAALALLSFLGTVALARYCERRVRS